MSGNLSSPTNESTGTDGSIDSTSNSAQGSSQIEKSDPSLKFSNTNELGKQEDMSKMGGSIVGLRSNMFSSSHGNTKLSNNEKLPEAKPRVSSLSTTNPTKSSSSGISSKISPTVSAAGEETSNAVSTSGLGLRPKPLPKPRPWSIVGVDRKSGEMTSVGAGTSASPPSKLATDGAKSNAERHPNPQESDKEKKTENKFREPTRRQSSGSGSAAGNRGSVRDMINNMNKGQSVTTSTPASERKGSSLPRGVQPQSAAVSDVARKFSSDSHKSGTSSPGSNKKLSSEKGSTETRDCKDDPRILKLDDDFDVLEV